MAFVTCSQFKTSQEEQEKRMISAEDELLDKSSGVGGGKVTVEKIKEAIGGDVAIAVKSKSGIAGNGTKKNPLHLNLGETLEVDDTGKLGVNAANIAGLGLVDASGEFALPQYRTKADGEQAENGNIPVVAPMNIGKGLLWDPVTKTYYVAIDNRTFEIDELGRLKLRISALEDNQLSVRNDGVYQGGTARPELRNLYVDAVSGVDQDPLQVAGAGTRSKPLKTLQYALKLGERDTTRFIYLYEGQDHICSAENVTVVRSGRCTLYPYGPTMDSYIGVEPSLTSARSRLAEENKEPKVVFSGVSTSKNNTGTESYFLFTNLSLVSTKLEFDGVSIVNDLNYTLNPSGVSDAGIRTFARIQGSGEIYTTRGRLFTKGRSTSNVSGLEVEENGLNKVGLFYGNNLIINLYHTINNIATDLDCNVLTSHGWSTAPDNTTSVNARGNSVANQQAIAKRIVGVKKQTVGNGFIITIPSTVIDYTYFA